MIVTRTASTVKKLNRSPDKNGSTPHNLTLLKGSGDLDGVNQGELPSIRAVFWSQSSLNVLRV